MKLSFIAPNRHRYVVLCNGRVIASSQSFAAAEGYLHLAIRPHASELCMLARFAVADRERWGRA